MRNRRAPRPQRLNRSIWVMTLVTAVGGLLTSCESPEPSAAPVATNIQPTASYHQIRRLSADYGMEACPPELAPCHSEQAMVAASSASGWVVVAGERAKQSQLFRFSPSGDIAPIGRRGSGPGEYQHVAALHVSPDGAVTAFDLLQRRLLRYDASGLPSGDSFVSLPDGFVFAAILDTGLVALATDPRRQSGDSAGVSLFVFDSASGGFRRLARLPIRDRVFSNDALRPVPMPFAAHPLWTMTPDGGVYFTPAGVHEISRFDLSGAFLLRFGSQVTPREVTQADLEALQQDRLRLIPPGPMRDAARASARTSAKFHPAITRLVALSNGELWMRESPFEPRDSVQWLAYSGVDGRALGRLVLGADDDVLASANGRLLMLTAAPGTEETTLRWVTIVR